MSECCICFESEDVEPLECCGGFLHEHCKQQWFLETRNCPLCRSYECRPQAAPLVDSGVNNNLLAHVQAITTELAHDIRTLFNTSTTDLETRVAELRAQNTEYWNDHIDMQSEIHDLEVENNMLQSQMEVMDTALTQSVTTNMRLENRISQMRGRMQDLEEANEQLVEQVVNLQQTVDELRTEILQRAVDDLRAPPRRVRRAIC